jgi:small subunit ribosomal protein S17
MSDANESKPDRSTRRAVIGVVTSDKMQNTIVVRVDRLVKHPVFKKYLRRKSIYKAHDPKSEAKVGDRVEIAECRPISKTKRFRLVRILKKSIVVDLDFAKEG